MPLFAGFATSISLIVAIGAQNAFVLRQGLRREHVLPVVLTCALSDALLISSGILGLGALLTRRQLALDIAKFGGAAFLYTYAALAARRAFNPGAITPADHAPAGSTGGDSRLSRPRLARSGEAHRDPRVAQHHPRWRDRHGTLH